MVADPMHDAAVSTYLGLDAQRSGVGVDKAAASMLRTVLENPFCWEFDVNDADFCCAQGSGAPTDVAYIFYSPSSQGTKPRPNCSHLGLTSTDFNGVGVANTSLTKLLQSRFG